MKKEAVITFRTDNKTKSILLKLAKKKGLSLSQLCEKIIRIWIAKKLSHKK